MAGTVAVVLAAGQGKRMDSELPKVLHLLAGRPMIAYVLEALKEAGIEEQVIVVGYQGDKVRSALGEEYRYAWQDPPLGTGHAVLQAEAVLPAKAGTVVVVCGDTPLLPGATIRRLVEYHLFSKAQATVLTARRADPVGYGRVIRGPDGEVAGIVEEKDAGPAERAIQETNTGTYCFERSALFAALRQVGTANAQAEYYLPDVLTILARRGGKVAALESAAEETMGINSRSELAAAAALLRRRLNEALMAAGVTLVDPDFTYVDATVQVGRETVLYPGTVLEGPTVIGEGCRIGPFTTIRASRVGCDVEAGYAVVVESEVGDGCRIGPFSYLRPGTRLAAGVKVGDFVEIKNSEIGEGSKVPHLTYLGDAVVGKGVNVGAGVITCNYDGKRKWPTLIEDEVFIGSNTNLVAPVRVGRGAYIGAGSTITRDVPAGSLGVARSRQTNIGDWLGRRRRKREELVEKGEEGRK